MSLLVTGGRGLVGSAIEADLKPTHAELELMDLDAIEAYLQANHVTKIVHCAAKVGGIKANMDQLGEFFYANTIINNVLNTYTAVIIYKNSGISMTLI